MPKKVSKKKTKEINALEERIKFLVEKFGPNRVFGNEEILRLLRELYDILCLVEIGITCPDCKGEEPEHECDCEYCEESLCFTCDGEGVVYEGL